MSDRPLEAATKALEDARSKDVKLKLGALDALTALVDELRGEQIAEVADLCPVLLADTNHKVVCGLLKLLAKIICTQQDAIWPYAHLIVPHTVERLSHAQQQVRADAFDVLLLLFKCLRPSFVLEKMTRFWNHKHWKVRHGVLQTIAEALTDGVPLVSTKDQANHIITNVVNLVEDPNETVRDAAFECMQELYRVLDADLVENIRHQDIRPAAFRELVQRLNDVKPTGLMPPEQSPAPGSRRLSLATAPAPAEGADEEPGPAAKVARPSSSRNGPAAPASGSDAAGEVAPIAVSSERELVHEVESLVPLLASLQTDWQQRVAGIARLEGLAKGNPGMLDVLADALRTLRDCMSKQVEDRRSLVCKQACQTLGALSSVLGPARFQEHALFFLPILFKILPITIQVMAEAADQCVQTILASCQSSRLVPLLTGTLIRDKNAKIRAFLARYLVHVMQSWDPATSLKNYEDVEAAMKFAVQDSSADARIAARNMLAAYSEAMPDAAAAFMRKLEPALQEKLGRARGGSESSSARRGASALAAIKQTRPRAAASASSADISVMVLEPAQRVGAGGGLSTRPPSSSASSVVAAPAAAPERPPSQGLPPTDARRAGPGARKSLALPAAARVLPVLDHGPEGLPDSGLPKPAVPRRNSTSTYSVMGAVRVLAPPGATLAPSSSDALTAMETSRDSSPRAQGGAGAGAGVGPSSMAAAGNGPAVPRLANSRRSLNGGSSSSRVTSAWRASDVSDLAAALGTTSLQGPRAGLAKAIAAVLANGKQWSERVEDLHALVDALQTSSSGFNEAGMAGRGSESAGCSGQPDVSRDLERVLPRLVESIDDSHHKVAMAALEALCLVVRTNPRTLECGGVDRVLGLLLGRACDPKFVGPAKDVLSAMAGAYSADVLLQALVRSLESLKQPRAKLEAMDFFCSSIGQGLPAGMPTNHVQLKQWLSRVAPLLNDKNMDLRRKAIEVIKTLVERLDAASHVVAYAQHASGAEGMTLRRIVAQIGDAAAGGYPVTLDTSSALDPGSLQPSTRASEQQQQQLAPPGAYHAAEYMTPARIDPAAVASVGPLPAHQPPPGGPLERNTSYCTSSSSGEGRAMLASYPLSSLSAENSRQALGNGCSSSASNTHLIAALPVAHSGGGGPTPSLPASCDALAAVTVVGSTHANACSRAGPAAEGMAAAMDLPLARLYQQKTDYVVAMDKSGAQRQIAMLHMRLQGLAASAEALMQLAACAERAAPDAWDQQFAPVVVAVLTTLRASAWDVRCASLLLVATLAKRLHVLFRPNVVSKLVPALLTAATDSVREVSRAAGAALDNVVQHSPCCLHCAEVLLTNMPPPELCPSDEGSLLYAAIKGLQLAAKRLDPEELWPLTESGILPRLVAALNHARVDVRKATVFCLVQMWAKLLNRLTPLLTALPVSQRALVDDYMWRHHSTTGLGKPLEHTKAHLPATPAA